MMERAGSHHDPLAFRRLWSLSDMLRDYALNYIELGSDIEKIRALFARAFETNSDLSAADRTDVRVMLLDLAGVCKKLNLPVAVRTVGRAEHVMPRTSGELETLLFGVYAELEARELFFIPTHLSPYYDWDEVVSEKVAEAFPNASDEIREAANCFALERFTACVFHAMRAAEIGLRALGARLKIHIKGGKPIELAEWRAILDGLSTAIRDFENLPNDTPNKDEDLRIYSEACAQFRFFKNGWRIRVAHARASYTESQASETLDHIRPFFETLSERLAEPL